MSRRFGEFPYGRVASFYDELAKAYSLGRIGRSKRHGLTFMKPGERVLFAGVGSGEEAHEAAASGVDVTAIDLSKEMLGRFEERLAKAGLRADLLLEDASEHVPPGEGYDVVAAHYFLNLFEAERAEEMLGKLVRLLRPGGKIVVADFAPPTAGLAARGITAAYYRPVNVIAWALGFCALHPIFDYRPCFEAKGLILRDMQSYSLFPRLGRFSPGYVSLVAERTIAT